MTPDELKTIRAELGMTQAEFAAAMNTTRVSIARYETGVHPVPRWMPIALRGLALQPRAPQKR